MASWITGFFPEHHSYLEPYFGSGAVLFNKPASNIETINDLDGNVVNLFACIRQDPEKLVWLVSATPYAREVFEEAYELGRRDSYEQALRFLIRCDMGHGFRTNGEKVGWKIDLQGREKAYAVKHWNSLPELIITAADRLKQVQIENRPAIDVIRRFNFPNVLIYADPPYLLETRCKKQYRCEMNDSDHEALLDCLIKHKGFVILSGYESEMYNSKLSGWHKETKLSRNQNQAIRREVLWMNFEPTVQEQIGGQG